MLVFGTQMHIVTFLFVCIELVILSYLVIYRIARPDDTATALDITLIILLLTYNISGGVLPDPNLPGTYFIQESIAYGTGFITPCYFPYYAYKAFDLKKMKFHASRGVYFFLIVPYLLFVSVFYLSDDLDNAQDLLFIPVMYALWVFYSVWKAIRFKYKHDGSNKKLNEEIIVFCFSLIPWIGLPFIAYFDLSQATEALTTNTGFLLLLALHLKRNVEQIRTEHKRLVESEVYLLNWNERLQQEVDKRTRELEKISAEERLIKNCKLYCLTNRETEIAQLICMGNTHKQIAESLFIAERTVAKHSQNIFSKIHVSNKMELSRKLES